MRKQKSKILWWLLVIFVLCFFNIPSVKSATWVEPTCNPSDPSDIVNCAVSPPLNTSIDTQVKDGSLYIGDIDTAGTVTGAGFKLNTTGIFSVYDSGAKEEFRLDPAYVSGSNTYGYLKVGYYTGATSYQRGWVDVMNNSATPGVRLFGSAVYTTYIQPFNNSSSTTTLNSTAGRATGTVLSGAINLTAIGTISTPSTTAGAINLTSGGSISSTVYNGSINLTPYGSGIVKIAGSGELFIEKADSSETDPALKITNNDADSIAMTISNAGSKSGLSVSSTASAEPAIIGENTGTGTGVGVYGSSKAANGVLGNTQSATSYGVAGCNNGTYNCGYLGGSVYAGNFAGQVYSSRDMVASKFLATNKQYSPYPYTQAAIEDIHELPFVVSGATSNFEIYDMVWDGNYMWVAAKTNPGGPGEFGILKMQSGDSNPVQLCGGAGGPGCLLTTFVSKDIISVADKIILIDDNNLISNNCTVYTVDKDDFSENHISTGRTSGSGATGCRSLTTDGNYIIFSVPVNNRIYVYNNDALLSVKTLIDSTNCTNFSSCTSLTNLVFDGTNLWATCASSGGILKISDFSSVIASGTYSFTGTYYKDNANINLMFYDGSYMWTTYNSGTPLRKLDPTSTTTVGSNTYLKEVKSYPTLSLGITDIDFDGMNIWFTNSSMNQVYIIPAYSPSTIDTPKTLDGARQLAFDGVLMWNSYRDATSGDDLKMWSTSSGGFTSNGHKYFRGMVMAGMNGGMFCVVIDDTTPAERWNIYDSTASEFGYYCGD